MAQYNQMTLEASNGSDFFSEGDIMTFRFPTRQLAMIDTSNMCLNYTVEILYDVNTEVLNQDFSAEDTIMLSGNSMSYFKTITISINDNIIDTVMNPSMFLALKDRYSSNYTHNRVMAECYGMQSSPNVAIICSGKHYRNEEKSSLKGYHIANIQGVLSNKINAMIPGDQDIQISFLLEYGSAILRYIGSIEEDVMGAATKTDGTPAVDFYGDPLMVVTGTSNRDSVPYNIRYKITNPFLSYSVINYFDRREHELAMKNNSEALSYSSRSYVYRSAKIPANTFGQVRIPLNVNLSSARELYCFFQSANDQWGQYGSTNPNLLKDGIQIVSGSRRFPEKALSCANPSSVIRQNYLTLNGDIDNTHSAGYFSYESFCRASDNIEGYYPLSNTPLTYLNFWEQYQQNTFGVVIDLKNKLETSVINGSELSVSLNSYCQLLIDKPLSTSYTVHFFITHDKWITINPDRTVSVIS